jgi:hypothetical protein
VGWGGGGGGALQEGACEKHGFGERYIEVFEGGNPLGNLWLVCVKTTQIEEQGIWSGCVRLRTGTRKGRL